MKIGITYDLIDGYLSEGYDLEQIAEFDKPETIEGIETSLRALGHTTERIGNAKQLMSALTNHQSWDLVFNIAEGLFGFGREAVVPSILETYKIPYTFSDPLVLSLCLHKGLTKIVVKHFGIPTADFAIAQNVDDLKDIKLDYPLFIKPVAEGTGKGIDSKSIINSRADLAASGERLLHKFQQPILVETFLAGREFTVGIVGTGKDAKSLGILEVLFTEHSEQNVYSYKNKAEYKKRIKYALLDDKDVLAGKINAVALGAWRALNCRDAGRVDIRLNEKEIPMFMEVNPLAGLNPVDSDLPILCRLCGISYNKLIKMIMDSVLSRI